MERILIGNIILFIACVIMSISGIPKSKKTTLTLQTIQIIIAGIANLVLQSYPGSFTNFLSAIRNILCQKGKLTTPIKIVLGVVVVVVSLLANNIGIFVMFPIASYIMFLAFMNNKDPIVLKWLMVIAGVIWGIHDFYIMAYTGVFFDVLSIITSFIGIYRIKRVKKKSNQIKPNEKVMREKIRTSHTFILLL